MTPPNLLLTSGFAPISPADGSYVFLYGTPLVILAVVGILASVAKAINRSSIRRRSLGSDELTAALSEVEAESARSLEQTLLTIRGGLTRSARSAKTVDTEIAIEAAEERKEIELAQATALFVRRKARAFDRGANRITWAVALSGSVLSMFAVVPFVATAAEQNNSSVSEWNADKAEWALDKYGVTAGMDDLAERSGGLFSFLYQQPLGGRVIAQGAIVDITLEFVGDQPVLLLDGEVNNELPLVGEEPASSDAVEVTE